MHVQKAKFQYKYCHHHGYKLPLQVSSIQLLKLMSKKINRFSFKQSFQSPPSSRSPSPCDSSSSKRSRVEEDSFRVASGSLRRHQSEWYSRREKVHRDLRVMEYCLVLASGMMKELNTPEIIARNCYFGRYGLVEKAIIISKHTNRGVQLQAFVTFPNEKDTAFAIAAVRNLQHHSTSEMRAHYGTTRYCSFFISGYVCQHHTCYYNHQIRDNHTHKNRLQGTLGEQYERVKNIIAQNLEYFVEKEYHQFKNKDKLDQEVICSCGRVEEFITFPTCNQVLMKLIAEGCIKQADYDTAKAKIKDMNQKQRLRCTSLQVQNKQNKELEVEHQEEPFLKKMETLQTLSRSPASQHSINDSNFPALPINLPKSNFSSPNQQQYLMPKKSAKCDAETLEEYIVHNILDDFNSASKQHPSLTERSCVEKPFFVEKKGEKFGHSRCQSKDLNPERGTYTYLIHHMIGKRFAANKISRFPFVACVNIKKQAFEERKVREIIGKKLMNLLC